MDDLPLFPLGTVLFPDGHLPLRIFEARYLDLVRECSRSGQPFGVCAVLPDPDAEADSEATTTTAAATGTLAHIIDFNTQPDGLLGIQAVGGRRFHVEHSRVASNGLLRARVQLLPEAAPLPVPPEYGLLATLLDRLLERAGNALPERLRQQRDEASWLAWRMAELLPLALTERQQLLEIDDPPLRVQRLLELLPRFQRDRD